ncbi:MAG: hypothetical protein AAFY66_00150 [Pseudomonadota bacterium]
MAHDHPHGHGHGHGNAHVHGHAHGGGHNHDPAGHLHSHMAPEDEAADLQTLCTQFIEGFRDASDKAAYLRLAGVPLERPDGEGRAPLKLVDVRITSEWQVGTASPSFGSRELSYLPFPGEMVTERTNMAFLYVSLDRTEETDLRAFLQERLLPENARS